MNNKVEVMDYASIVGYSKQLAEIGSRGDEFIGDELRRFKRLNAIDEPQDLLRTFEALATEDRMLNIGIIGRVKAGKSSLLNALVFEGRAVLPKAATPMTAALTTLTWGEHFAVSVEFFSEEDRRRIEEQAKEYARELNTKKSLFLEKLIERNRQRSERREPPILDIESRAHEQAQQEMKRREDLASAHDQFQRMNQSQILPIELESNSNLELSSEQELIEALLDYVSANGRFMPYTKSVNITLPIEGLKGLRIIDTPGLNDPVQSREARTVELLKTCDVIFIVSPAGQFLNEHDQNLMLRITTKEGIQELVLVCSKVDSELHGNEKTTNLHDTLKDIHSQLSKRAIEVLGALKNDAGPVFNGLCKSVQENLLHNSGICEGLRVRFEDQTGWNEDEQHVWKLLQQDYPDYFPENNADVSRDNLGRIANTKAIHLAIETVAKQKTEIVRDRLGKLAAIKSKNLNDYQSEIVRLIKQYIDTIQNTNAEVLGVQRKKLENQRDKLKIGIDLKYRFFRARFLLDLRRELKEEIDKLFGKAEESIKNLETNETRQFRVEKEGAANWLARTGWGGGYEARSEQVLKISTPQVINEIQKFIHNVGDVLDNAAEDKSTQLNKELPTILIPLLREFLELQGNDDAAIMKAINHILDAIPNESLTFDSSIPNHLIGRKTLKGNEAEEFKDDITEFFCDLGDRARKHAYAYENKIKSDMPENISEEFIAGLVSQIDTLKNQIENAAQTIDRLNRLVKQAEEVTPA